VDTLNPAYRSVEGVLFNSNQTRLIQYPSAKSDSTYAIPASVTSVVNYAFQGCSSLTSVTIHASVTTIGSDAFQGCSSLISVTIPASVTTIKISAFQGCSSLTSVTIPASVTSIGERAFQGCSSLTSVTIPASVTSIGERAFQGCSRLATITVDTLNPAYRSVEGVLFNSNQTRLVQYPSVKNDSTYTIPANVTSIVNFAFQGCSSLTSVTIPSSVTTIGSYVFQGCSSLTSVTIPASVTTIGSYAFQGCSSLTSVTIPASVSTIGSYAFQYCSSLTSATIPLGVTIIGDSAFEYCSSLTSVTIPSSVTRIGGWAFAYCGNLKSVTNLSQVSRISDGMFYSCTNLTSVTIPDSVTSIGDHAFSFCTSLASITIPARITNIGAWSFSWCVKISNITIPANVAGIGAGAFYWCASLTSITVNATNAFYSSAGGILFNKSMTSLVQHPAARLGSYAIPGGITRIEAEAFTGCTNLTSVSIPASVTNFAEAYPFYSSPFDGCSRLTSITVNAANSVFSSVDGVLFNQAKTTLIRYPEGKTGGYIIPSSVIRIETGAFSKANKLASLTIPATVTNIEEGAFWYCPRLASITVSAANPAYCSAGGVLFNKLKTTLIQYPDNKPGNYTIPAGVTLIGRSAFSGCTSLASVNIPSSVTNIVAEASFGISCSNLTAITVDAANAFYSSVDGVLFNKQKTTLICHPGGKTGNYTIPPSVTCIGHYAFEYGSLTSVTIPSSVTNIGGWAFAWCTKLTAVYFQGNAPSIDGTLFYDDIQATIYYLPGTTGWTNPWGNRPTVSGSPPGQLCFAASAYSAQEGAVCKVRVKRIFGSSGTVSVTCVTKAVTATGPQDYTAVTNTLTWTNGQVAAKTFVIPIRADGKSEGAETFQVVLKNPVGTTLAAPFKTTVTILANTKGVSSGATAALTQKAPLAEALDGTGLSWLTSAQRPWTTQPFVTADGEDAAISGAADLERVSWLQADVEGPGTLTYDWLVKGLGLDTCLLLVDGNVMRARNPENGWAHENLTIDGGVHTIRWVFVGDTGLVPGAAYLDQVKWTPGGE
jgi:hypothetical protein